MILKMEGEAQCGHDVCSNKIDQIGLYIDVSINSINAAYMNQPKFILYISNMYLINKYTHYFMIKDNQ